MFVVIDSVWKMPNLFHAFYIDSISTSEIQDLNLWQIIKKILTAFSKTLTWLLGFWGCSNPGLESNWRCSMTDSYKKEEEWS